MRLDNLLGTWENIWRFIHSLIRYFRWKRNVYAVIFFVFRSFFSHFDQTWMDRIMIVTLLRPKWNTHTRISFKSFCCSLQQLNSIFSVHKMDYRLGCCTFMFACVCECEFGWFALLLKTTPFPFRNSLGETLPISCS